MIVDLVLSPNPEKKILAIFVVVASIDIITVKAMNTETSEEFGKIDSSKEFCSQVKDDRSSVYQF